MRKLFFYIMMWVPTFVGITKLSYAEGGYYLGLGAGYASMTNIPQNSFSFNNGSFASQNVGSFATAIYAGYDFNRIVGLQIDYNVAYNGWASGFIENQQLLDGAILVHLPFSIIADSLSGFSLYAKGGIGYSYYSFGQVSPTCTTCVFPPNDTSSAVPVYGLGAEYAFKDFIALRAEWSHSGNVTAANVGNNQLLLDSNMYFLSILYRF
ncbi:MAG: OmpA-like transrane domain [Burkholderiales bacterium]|jgi:opacity protein-like surface antigen|nr:OmpA-like transrane domain [Burkholderiales bacterium]